MHKDDINFQTAVSTPFSVAKELWTQPFDASSAEQDEVFPLSRNFLPGMISLHRCVYSCVKKFGHKVCLWLFLRFLQFSDEQPQGFHWQIEKNLGEQSWLKTYFIRC